MGQSYSKVVLDAVLGYLNPGVETHVVVGNNTQAVQLRDSLEGLIPQQKPAVLDLAQSEIPETRLLVGTVCSFCGRYLTLQLHDQSTDFCAYRDRLQGSQALLVSIDQHELEVPVRLKNCRNPRQDGTCELLGMMTMHELLAEYSSFTEIGCAD